MSIELRKKKSMNYKIELLKSIIPKSPGNAESCRLLGDIFWYGLIDWEEEMPLLTKLTGYEDFKRVDEVLSYVKEEKMDVIDKIYYIIGDRQRRTEYRSLVDNLSGEWPKNELLAKIFYSAAIAYEPNKDTSKDLALKIYAADFFQNPQNSGLKPNVEYEKKGYKPTDFAKALTEDSINICMSSFALATKTNKGSEQQQDSKTMSDDESPSFSMTRP